MKLALITDIFNRYINRFFNRYLNRRLNDIIEPQFQMFCCVILRVNAVLFMSCEKESLRGQHTTEAFLFARQKGQVFL